MKDILINKIIEELERENENREDYDKPLLDIPFMIITLEQSLEDDTYKEFLEDLKRYSFDVHFMEEYDEDKYIKERYIKVYLYEEGDEGDYYCDNFTNFEYKISFERDERYWGFCQCQEGDKDYDPRYRCCGHGCDWTAPAFSVEKITNIGRNVFCGDQHDFWEYRDKYNGVTLKDKEEAEKQARINFLLEEKSRIEKQLLELTNNISK